MKSDQQIQSYLTNPDLDKFGGNYEQACLFYFSLLKQLDLRILTTQIQIQNITTCSEKSRPHPPFQKTGRIKEQNPNLHQYQFPKPQLPPPQYVGNPNLFECKVKGCHKIFQKKSALEIHQILRHKTQAIEWTNNRVFSIEIREPGEGRRGSRGHY